MTNAWTVYGRAKTGMTKQGVVEMRGLHLDRAPSLEMANSYVEDAITAYGLGAVECVIVELQHGLDKYGMRRVIRRVSNAKAWWE